MMFASTSADIAIYGGAAGGGKSYGLLMEPLRHADNPNFGAVAFRRTSPQITSEGGLWDTAEALYPGTGATMLAGKREVRFPSGAKITFRHLQHEKDKLSWQGSQIPLIMFDEMTHFTESQFWYLLSRNRSACGVRPYIRGTCNPEAGHWILKLIQWWIDPATGFPIKERAGVVRYFIRQQGELIFADTAEELTEKYPESVPKSLTFIPSLLTDNPALMKADPGYLANLMALPRIERERLLGGNWLAREASVIDLAWLHEYTVNQTTGDLHFQRKGGPHQARRAELMRFFTIDTAGTSEDKAREQRGAEPSYSCCACWDYHQRTDSLFLRGMYRKRVDYVGLKLGMSRYIKEHTVGPGHVTYIENKHFGPALASELNVGEGRVEQVNAVLPNMQSSARGAKLERAIASGLLSRMEFGGFFVPDLNPEWLQEYRRECGAWTGLPDEVADQIDVSSYAAYKAENLTSHWGGVIF